MASKSCPTTSAIQATKFFTVQRGHHTDPIMYTVGDCTSDGRKTSSKRLAEESLERGSKRSRTSESSSEDSEQTFFTAKSVPAYSDPPVSKGEIQKLSSKGKSTSDGRDERPRTRSRPTPGPSESPDHQAEASTSDDIAPRHSRAALNAKYDEGELLGQGGFGSVFAGRRKADNLPVAIKHIRQVSSIKLTGIIMELEGKRCEVPLEVALLLKLQPKDGETSAVVALLDWYDLNNELILVLERPVPCVDMFRYIYSQWNPQSENEAKILVRQLVDALIEVHSKGVFHKDIKPANILVETGSDVPRVKIIDFGSGKLLTKRRYYTQQGTRCHTSPEWFSHGCYEAEPATVWQLGVAVFQMLHRRLPFQHQHEILYADPDINHSLSIDCQDFLMSCLVKDPESRSTLEELRSHFWLE